MSGTVGWGKIVPKMRFGPGDLSAEAANPGAMDPDDRPSSDDETVEGTDRTSESADGTGRPFQSGDGTDRRDPKSDDRDATYNDRSGAEEDGSVSDGESSEGDDGGDTTDGDDEDDFVDRSSANGSVGGIERDREDSDPGERGLASRFRHDGDGPLMWIREMLSSALIVLFIGLLLFAVSGVWPPMVAVESGSMEPNLDVGDLVFVTEPGRFAPGVADNEVGVVTYEAGQEADYRSFGTYGSVVIFQPPGRTASPIIHRAMFHVEEGENWYDRADDRFHRAEDCGELRNCPAPHDGFITLGDNNAQYDQANGLAEPVRAEWVTGVARLRVPYLGYVRLIATGQADIGDVLSTGITVDPGPTAAAATPSVDADPRIAGPMTRSTPPRSTVHTTHTTAACSVT